jgi:hypothetical protein
VTGSKLYPSNEFRLHLRSPINVGFGYMTSDVIYFILLGVGWFFLLGWILALATACALAFRREPDGDAEDSTPTLDKHGMRVA